MPALNLILSVAECWHSGEIAAQNERFLNNDYSVDCYSTYYLAYW
ncbi:hypothetical protein XSR1_20065 [Xenorhabdus szentirmaii DSM 16338]|uniref:Uncharacterized protein n=1 Tax=Xenorhabdus szentirmaii DSM 16338 TaxID=1427518 RepID=W1IWN3_9GAMM|nr:hypothetical protein XSR1_20065 [Xenorhabdus szentirmaii DSM 16338]